MKNRSFLLLALVLVGMSAIPARAQCICTNLLLYSTNSGYSQVAVDDTFVYFGDNAGNIKKVPKTGGTVTTVATYPGNRVITGVAADATHLYVGVVGPLPQGYTANVGAIASVPKTGGTFTTLTTLATNVIYLEVDGTHVYWDSYGYFPAPGWPQANGFIARVPKAGGAVELLATGLATSDNFALDGNDVYFGETGYVSPAFTGGRDQEGGQDRRHGDAPLLRRHRLRFHRRRLHLWQQPFRWRNLSGAEDRRSAAKLPGRIGVPGPGQAPRQPPLFRRGRQCGGKWFRGRA